MATTRLESLSLLGVGCVVLAGTGCAPVFSEFQGAKLVGRGGVEVTPKKPAARP
jgi:hypothetical protein